MWCSFVVHCCGGLLFLLPLMLLWCANAWCGACIVCMCIIVVFHCYRLSSHHVPLLCKWEIILSHFLVVHCHIGFSFEYWYFFVWWFCCAWMLWSLLSLVLSCCACAYCDACVVQKCIIVTFMLVIKGASL